MNKAFFTLLLIASLPFAAFASTAPEDVNRIDNAREGNLRQLVLAEFAHKYQIPCDGPNELPKFDIIKLSSASNNETKQLGTPYDYEASYLLVQKCLYGTTYAGAYSEPKRTVILKGSFVSKYNSKNGPAKMEELSIEFVSEPNISK